VFGAAALVVGLGLLGVLAVVAAATWVLTGRALRPIEHMRSEAAQISEGALDRRLAVPHTADEVSRLATTLNEMLQRLDEAAAARRRFVADASHELRSPVAAMRAMLDVTAAGSPDPGLLGALDAEVARLEQLVGDLLALARSDQTPRPRVSEVDVDQALRAEAEAMRQRSSLRVDTSGVEAGRVLADPDAVARLIRNLGDNALRHARTQVWLTTRVSDGVVTIGVDDDGTGISPEDRERVFDRLVRLDPARDRTTGGSGLGLSVVRALARDAGGDAHFVEPRHGGASAEVHLPAAPD
jgi:signal transduction histidine kinase